MTSFARIDLAKGPRRLLNCRGLRLFSAAGCIAVTMLVLAGCGSSDTATQNNTAAHDALKSTIKKGRYQAVILTNDRVYFGHLKALGNGWYRLNDAFFIRQVTDDKSKTATQKVTPVGDELQQPDSTVMLNRDNIVQVENLSQNSRVAMAIAGLAR